jgi:hypothetical protein
MTTEQEAVREFGVQFLILRQDLDGLALWCRNAARNGWRLNSAVTQQLQALFHDAAGMGTWDVASELSPDLRVVRLTVFAQVPADAYAEVRRRILDQVSDMPIEMEGGVAKYTARSRPISPLFRAIFDVLDIQAPDT